MFYKLNDVAVIAAKQEIFPQQKEDSFLKRVIIRSYGTKKENNSLEVFLSIKDSINQAFKKFMFLKVFEISNTEMLSEVQGFTDIDSLQKTINKYKANYFDISPTLFNKSFNENTQEYLYDVKFLLPRKNINYFSLGLIFYLDKQEYIDKQNLQEAYIDKQMLYGSLNVYPLIDETDLLVEENADKIQDLRTLSGAFKENQEINNLLAIINSDNSYSPFLNAKRHLSENLPKQDDGLISTLMKASYQKPNANLFSDLFVSNNGDASIGLLFNFNYYKAINDNSPYIKLLNLQNISDYASKCKISSIKILRQTLTKNKQPIRDSIVQIANSSDTANGTISKIEDKEKDILLSEINLKLNENVFLRTFCATDKSAFSKKAYYQYGVEITIADSITKALSDLVINLSTDITNLKNYLEETNKISRTIQIDGSFVTKGSYTAEGYFTNSFINNFLQSNFRIYVTNAINNFASTLYLMNFIKTTEAIDKVKMDVAPFLVPTTATAETISYFIKTYENLISNINKIIKDNKNSSFTIKKWFINDVINTNLPSYVGYKFLNHTYENGFGQINLTEYSNTVDRNHNTVINSTTRNINTYLQDTKQSFLIPETVSSINSSLDFKSLLNDPNSISNLEYLDLETDIKNLLFYGNDALSPDPVLKNETKENKLLSRASARTAKMASLLSLETNQYYEEKKSRNSNKTNKETKTKLNEDVKSVHMLMSLLKNYNLQNKKFEKNFINYNEKLYNFSLNQNRNKVLRENTSPSRNKNRLLLDDDPRKRTPDIKLPYQIHFFTENGHKIVKKNENNLNYKNLEYISKMNFMFNTIHQVEFLTLDQNLKPVWSLLTGPIINKMISGEVHLCRLMNYVNLDVGVEGIKQIDLPIFNKYFLFTIPQAEIKGIKVAPKNIPAARLAAIIAADNVRELPTNTSVAGAIRNSILSRTTTRNQ